MAQYLSIKKRYPGTILLFRLGDFYEMFYEDAKVASQVLGIALTGRFAGENRVPMAGIPVQRAQTYIARLLEAGHRLAVCEQLEDPAQAQGRIVERGVVRVITPGTLVEEIPLDERRNNHLASLSWDGHRGALGWCDLSTGSFQVEAIPDRYRLFDELTRIAPAELLAPEDLNPALRNEVSRGIAGAVTLRPAESYHPARAALAIRKHFETESIEPLGLASPHEVAAAGALLEYLQETQKAPVQHIQRIETYSHDGRMIVDRAAQFALELVESNRDRKVDGTLLSVLDHAATSMGSRKVREWILAPLTDVAKIRQRLDAVQTLLPETNLGPLLRQVGDLERLIARLGSGRASPRDLAALRESLRPLPGIREAIPAGSSLLDELRRKIDPHEPLRALIERAIVDTPPHTLTDGGVIRRGYDPELDRLVGLRDNSQETLRAIERREAERTGIPSLKVAYNSVFGYYIEITNAHAAKVPPDYVRKQTLKNAERYITAELKDLETQILNAEEAARSMERRLFEDLRRQAAGWIAGLQATARALATLDALLSLAEAARKFGYVRPEVDDSRTIEIQEGRHPVLERTLPDAFVPNDLRLDPERRFALITGPNMAGKSTFLRQTAILALMAQMGSFVPARRARIGVCDRIFTRVGASDEIARGVSTFMQEMIETASILRQATDRSLVILDELGRGTSTYDGMSIAWAVCEQLHNAVRARTLFATHYHELVRLAETLPGLRNFHAAVREWKGDVVFLHRIVEGPSNRSYGIHVARLAGLPKEVVDRARRVLEKLEEAAGGFRPQDAVQLSLFASPEASAPPPPHPILQELQTLDTNRLTPLQALEKIDQWIRAMKPVSDPANR